jgi:NAD-dependent deacetylase
MQSMIRPIIHCQYNDDLHVGDLAPDGGQLRPHIVFFGEPVPMFEKASEIASKADIFIVVEHPWSLSGSIANLKYSDNFPVYLVDPSTFKS